MPIYFDRSYWPKSGTTVPSFPRDLSDLWNDCEDQASIFVAEALIGEEPHSHLDNDEDRLLILTYLWSVGGDSLAMREPLLEMLEGFGNDYDRIRGPAQAEDLREKISALDALTAGIDKAKKRMQALISAWNPEDSN